MTAGNLMASRDERRAIYAQERRERASGKWSPWTKVSQKEIAYAMRAADAAFENAPHGWTREVHTSWRNGWMSVSVRTIPRTALGFSVDHAFFRTALQAELGWKEKQRVKDELFGADRMAIEVFPRSVELVDAADMYHLWVFPAGVSFDFGL